LHRSALARTGRRRVLGGCSMAPAVVPSSRESACARRRPEKLALHQVVHENLLTLYAAIEDGFAAALPGHWPWAKLLKRSLCVDANDDALSASLAERGLGPPTAPSH
jgi:hypothetical protein